MAHVILISQPFEHFRPSVYVALTNCTAIIYGWISHTCLVAILLIPSLITCPLSLTLGTHVQRG